MKTYHPWLPQDLTFTSHLGSTGGGRWQQVVIDSSDWVSLIFKAWLWGGGWGVGSGPVTVEGPKRMVARGQLPPPCCLSP